MLSYTPVFSKAGVVRGLVSLHLRQASQARLFGVAQNPQDLVGVVEAQGAKALT